jgi:hypothetical protein
MDKSFLKDAIKFLALLRVVAIPNDERLPADWKKGEANPALITISLYEISCMRICAYVQEINLNRSP